MIGEMQVSLFDLVMGLSDAVDLVSPAVANHHKQVAYVAFSIGGELGLPVEEQRDLVLAGALHDIGGLSLKDRIDAMKFEIEKPHEHAELGYSLIKTFEPLSNVAKLVRFHHVPWNEGEGAHFRGKRVPIGSHILHLADRLTVLIDKRKEILGQAGTIGERIEKQSGKKFMPDLVDTFKNLAHREYFWLEVTYPSIDSILSRRVELATVQLDIEDLLSLTKLISHIIDFRSRFTATHSSGVAAVAEALAKLVGFSEQECSMVKIAGYLHDLGKLSVPAEILEKPAKLTEDEFNVMRKHTFYTYRILERIGVLDDISSWASFHHERISGSGYPFHIRDQGLSLISRILAVADVFTAITEDRPYRKGMTSDEALQVLQQMVDNSALDFGVVSLLKLRFDDINCIRAAAQTTAFREYQEFGRQVD